MSLLVTGGCLKIVVMNNMELWGYVASSQVLYDWHIA